MGWRGEPAGCLDQVLGRTRTLLEAEETRIRAYETSLGDWLADLMLAAFAGQGAQVAFFNASLRLTRDIPPGPEITRRDFEEMFEYPSALRLLRLDGATLQQVAAHAVAGWPGKGGWLQVGGFAFRHDPDAGRPYDLTLLAPEGPRPVAPGEAILAVTVQYLVDPGGDQDGYTMLGPGQVVAEGPELSALARSALAATEPQGIAPEREGRICNPPDAALCRAVVLD